MSFGERLQERRKILGITQVQLAKILNVSKGAIGNYESGLSSPKAEILYKLFDILHCDANFLFQDEMSCEQKKSSFSIQTITEDKLLTEILDIYYELNEEGKEKIKDYSRDLSINPRYKKENQFRLDSKEA